MKRKKTTSDRLYLCFTDSLILHLAISDHLGYTDEFFAVKAQLMFLILFQNVDFR